MLQQDGEKDHIFVCAHLSNHNRLYIKQGILTNHILCIKKPCRERRFHVSSHVCYDVQKGGNFATKV